MTPAQKPGRTRAEIADIKRGFVSTIIDDVSFGWLAGRPHAEQVDQIVAHWPAALTDPEPADAGAGVLDRKIELVMLLQRHGSVPASQAESVAKTMLWFVDRLSTGRSDAGICHATGDEHGNFACPLSRPDAGNADWVRGVEDAARIVEAMPALRPISPKHVRANGPADFAAAIRALTPGVAYSYPLSYVGVNPQPPAREDAPVPAAVEQVTRERVSWNERDVAVAYHAAANGTPLHWGGMRAALTVALEAVEARASAAETALRDERARGELRDDLLREVQTKGLIYWEPRTARGFDAKADMNARIDAVLTPGSEAQEGRS